MTVHENANQTGCPVWLDARERAILEYRLLAEKPYSYAWLAKRLGTSAERVRQLESKLRGKIRKGLYVEFPMLDDPDEPHPGSRKLPQ